MSADYDNRYAPEPLAARLQLKLDRLSEWHALDVHCVNCRHAGYIAATKLRRCYPGRMKIVDMAHRFKCTKCHSRGCVEWTLVKQKR